MVSVQHTETNFYIALPSDSSTKYFPENTLSGYTTNLPREIVLNGNWECGVSEVQYPLSFFNVSEDMSLSKVYSSIRQQTLRFSPGFYTTNDVVKKINVLISKDRGEIKIDSHSGKIRITTGTYPLHMSPALYAFLGRDFEPKSENGIFEKSTTYKGLRVIDTRQSFNTLFIYCDTLAPRIVGDTNSSLLVTLPNGGKRVLFGDTVTTRFTKIMYYPVAKRRFHTIRIDVRTDVCAPAKFEGGKVFVELHFGKVINA